MGLIEALPGMPALLGALDGLPTSFLVGGAVRDLLRGAVAVDFDVVVEGDALESARIVASRLGGEAIEHQRFGTARVSAPELRVDFAMARRERYRSPGDLPDVKPATLAEDLARRDFTINAMAVGLTGGDLGHLLDPHGGQTDLEQRLVRVLHDRSFRDDPTRLLRALRYAARIDGRLEPWTGRLARDAIAAGAPVAVSGTRVREELLALLAEANAPTALALMRDLRLDQALDPALCVDPERVASAMLGAAETAADPTLAGLAAMLVHAPDALAGWLAGLNLGRDARERVLRAGRQAPSLAAELRNDPASSRIHDLLEREPPEALALALALGAPAEPILLYLSELRGVRLEVTGADLVEAGVPNVAVIGSALAETLRRKLDGTVSGRTDELSLALKLARGDRP